MNIAKLLYPEAYEDEDDDWMGVSDYQPILDALGRIVIQVDDSDYQGDSRLLYQQGDRWGYLQFGWGSCSGCDMLRACSSYKEIDDVIDYLLDAIKWFESSLECLKFFKEHDWKGDYRWHEKEQQSFIDQVIQKLEEDNGLCRS